jgi:hypothetical protein
MVSDMRRRTSPFAFWIFPSPHPDNEAMKWKEGKGRERKGTKALKVERGEQTSFPCRIFYFTAELVQIFSPCKMTPSLYMRRECLVIF